LEVRRTAFERVRIYETLRTAHLERAHQLVPASIIYRVRRYDFDSSLADGLDLIRAGPLGTACTLAFSRVRELEVNEPLMVSSLRRTLLAVVVVRVAGRLRRLPVRIVTYAIGNDDPFRPPARAGLRGRGRRVVDRALLHLVARNVDRIVFGTDAARALYERMVPGIARRADVASIPAVPAACGCAPVEERDPDRVLFVGSFENRKGFPQLLAAWPEVVTRHPGACLTLLGKGPLLADAEDLASGHGAVDLVVDPPRQEVHRHLRASAVLVLLSQPTPTWREQVGLPLVEGLAHGCAVLASTETGLADWLAVHGHGVLAPDAGPHELAAEIVRLLAARRPSESVLADLPGVDGRLAADAWLFRAQSADAACEPLG